MMRMVRSPFPSLAAIVVTLIASIGLVAVTSCGTGTAAYGPAPTVTIGANPATITPSASTTLTVTATNATSVTISNNVNGTTYTLSVTGGTEIVSPTTSTTYTVTASGTGGTVTAQVTVTVPPPTVTIAATPAKVGLGSSSTLTVVATGATSVVVTGTDNSTYTLGATGGTQVVTPTATTTYTATATGQSGTATAQTTVTVVPAGTVTSVNHVIFLMQENRSFDTYFGMLNPYRKANNMNVGDDGNTYNVDGIDDKLTTTNADDEGTSFPLFHTITSCLDDMTSSWLESYGDVNRYDFAPSRGINMDGFVHTAENYAKDASGGNTAGEGTFTDFTGQRAMAYYQDTSVSGNPELNYYYYMASQFALSDRWFSPVSSKTVPNRIATLTGGTTQGLAFDPFSDDKITTTLAIPTIFQELDQATPAVSWKIYYTLTEGSCNEKDGDCGAATGPGPVSGHYIFGLRLLRQIPLHAGGRQRHAWLLRWAQNRRWETHPTHSASTRPTLRH